MNYTEVQLSTLTNMKQTEQTIVDRLAFELSKTPKSIIGKLSREGVYRRSVYKTKTGESPVTKTELVEEIANSLDIDVEVLAGLEKSPKLVLKQLKDALVS